MPRRPPTPGCPHDHLGGLVATRPPYSPIPGEATSPPVVGKSRSVATSYEIRIRGKVGSSTLASFEDMEAAIQPAETVLRGEVTDQAQLHGLLERIQLLGLELIEIRRVSPTEAHETGT
jgi:hypothetical protein